MLVDTHCHINMMVKQEFDVPLKQENFLSADIIIKEAYKAGITRIINVGTSLVESINSIDLAQRFNTVYAAVGIHPNDCSPTWRDDFNHIKTLVADHTKNKIVALGECGLDKHYPDYDIQLQIDAFKAHLDLALEHDLAVIIHTRDAAQETMDVLDLYKHDKLRAVIHCFSEDQAFADHMIQQGFLLGIGGTLTYPKNENLRSIFKTIDLKKVILETDAPFLPPQYIRGKQNNPREIVTIAHFLAELRNQSFETIAEQTTHNALQLFNIK